MDIYIISFIFILLLILYIIIDNNKSYLRNKIKLFNLEKKMHQLKNKKPVDNFYNYSPSFLNYCNVPTLNTEQCFKSKYNRCPNTNGSFDQCTNNYMPNPDRFNALCENRTFEMTEPNKKISENCYNNFNQVENFSNDMLNIYNEPLKKCQENGMSNGSWDKNGMCSELDGGVHQICIKNISSNTPGFSKKTGQSNWSDNRKNNNHCVCLGAWSLYNNKTKNSNNILKCDAIPKVSLSNKYVSKFSNGWNKWNGLEVKGQIKDGIESMVKNCYNEKNKKSNNLKNNYCNLAKDVNDLNNSNLYKDLCLA